MKRVGVEIFDRVAERYDALSRFLSLGTIPRWQRELVKDIKKAKRLLDLACGTGEVTRLLEGKAEVVVGLDYSFPMLRVAKKKLSRTFLVRGDALSLPFKDRTFDVIVVSFGLRHFEDPETALEEIERVLKEGGKVRILEVAMPRNPLLKKLFLGFLKYFMLPVGKLRAKEDVTHHLYRTIVEFPHYEDLIKLAVSKGFKGGTFKPLMLGMTAIYELTK